MPVLTPGWTGAILSGVMACGLRALLIMTSLAATAKDLALSDVLVVHALPGATRWIRGERYVGAISDEEEATLKQAILDDLLLERQTMVTAVDGSTTFLWKEEEFKVYVEERRADPSPGAWSRLAYNETALPGHHYVPGHLYVLVLRMVSYSRLRAKIAAPSPEAARRGAPVEAPLAVREKLAGDRTLLWAGRLVVLATMGTLYVMGFDVSPAGRTGSPGARGA